MPTMKQRIGAWLIPRLPVNAWTFRANRLELNASRVRMLGCLHPSWIRARRALAQRKGLLGNIGCGSFGQEGWVNLDLYPARGLTLRTDCRRDLPVGDGSCVGIHVEHYLEPNRERGLFLAECRRCLEEDGEHYGGFDEAYLRGVLEAAGLRDVRQVAWREGAFPGGGIDRDQHRPYSLYMEARR